MTGLIKILDDVSTASRLRRPSAPLLSFLYALENSNEQQIFIVRQPVAEAKYFTFYRLSGVTMG